MRFITVKERSGYWRSLGILFAGVSGVQVSPCIGGALRTDSICRIRPCRANKFYMAVLRVMAFPAL